MNTSAKLTAVSFLAAVALGAAAFMGCTVTSGTVNDTDGGTQNNNDSGTPNSDGGGTATCQSNQNKERAVLGSASCQSCGEGACCAEIKTCFAIAAEKDDAGVALKTDCHDYVDCADKCINENPTDEAARAKCFQEDCDVAAADGVKAAYEEIVDCLTDKCATQCNQ